MVKHWTATRLHSSFLAHPPLLRSQDGRQYDWLVLISTTQEEPRGQDRFPMTASEQGETVKQIIDRSLLAIDYLSAVQYLVRSIQLAEGKMNWRIVG